MTNLANKTALVTGASRGIGRAAALALAKAGARVIVHYGNSKQQADEVVAQIKAGGGQADALGADMQAADGAHRLAAATRALVGERLDILVANAGVASMASIADTTVEAFDRMFAVNVRAPYFLVQQLLPVLGEGSSVILLSSGVARAAFPTTSAYAGTKGAIATLVRQFAAELGPQGIRVNAVAPGVIETDMASSFIGSSEGQEMVRGMQALKRIGQTDDIADVITFLAGNDSRWITGDSLSVDGGTKL